MIKPVLHTSNPVKPGPKIPASPTKTLLRGILVFCLFMGAAATLCPRSCAAAVFAEHPSNGLTQIRPLIFAERTLAATEAGSPGFPAAPPDHQAEIKPDSQKMLEGDQHAVSVLFDGMFTTQTLMWAAAFFWFCLILVLIFRRRSGRRRQKLALDVGRFPLVLPHLRPKAEHDGQEKL